MAFPLGAAVVVNVVVLMQSSLRILFSLSAESLVGCLELFCTSLCAIYDAYQEHSSTLN